MSKYCSNCGKELNQNAIFCPNCGGRVEVEDANVNQNMNSNVNSEVNQNMNSNMNNGVNQNMNSGTNNSTNANNGSTTINNYYNTNNTFLTKRDIATTVILSFVTCGIYGIFWLVNIVNDTNKVSERPTDPSGGLVVLYTLLTCGIYGIYWNYKNGQKLYEAGKKYNKNIQDNSVLYLVLSLFGLQIVNYCFMQSDLNKFAE